MRFPINFHGATALPGHRCNHCGIGSTTPEFVSFSVGATQDYAATAVDLSKTSAMMQLDWQGPSDSQGTGFAVVEETSDGGCVLNFCSTACLRRFFADCVDRLEHLIESAKAADSTDDE